MAPVLPFKGDFGTSHAGSLPRCYSSFASRRKGAVPTFLLWRIESVHGPKADIGARNSGCLLWATSRHRLDPAISVTQPDLTVVRPIV